ncbi:MAG: hypothetical protein COA45_05430 [Zetaproteobacteria bacterium]|nr:MAG: hypothetical protein COA45_05430 [Zetaproteobacteria bacterium]
MDSPLTAVQKITEHNYGDFYKEGGLLTLVFSKQTTSESAMKHMCSDLYATGIMEGQPTPLPHNIYDELSQELPTDLAENASIKLGQNADHIIIEIHTPAMSLVAE